jgi:hypothetical protein
MVGRYFVAAETNKQPPAFVCSAKMFGKEGVCKASSKLCKFTSPGVFYTIYNIKHKAQQLLTLLNY